MKDSKLGIYTLKQKKKSAIYMIECDWLTIVDWLFGLLFGLLVGWLFGARRVIGAAWRWLAFVWMFEKAFRKFMAP
jgi:hypothetical protein